MLLTCKTLGQIPGPKTLEPVVLKTTYTQLGCDSLLQCQRLELHDSALCVAMDDIILADSILQHVRKGEKTWYEICFYWFQDTMFIDLIANQYYKYSDLYRNNVYGIFCYKNEIFALRKTDPLPNDILSITNDIVSTNRLYEGCTVYFFQKEGQSIPENVLIRYQYDGEALIKQFTLFNDKNINAFSQYD